jgi:hypothetical protein
MVAHQVKMIDNLQKEAHCVARLKGKQKDFLKE